VVFFFGLGGFAAPHRKAPTKTIPFNI
jgi:hypothetical protein